MQCLLRVIFFAPGFTPDDNFPDPTDPQDKGALRGLTWYDEEQQALTYYNDDVDVQVNMGRELLYRVGNLGSDIPPGELVRVWAAGDGLPFVQRSQANTVNRSSVLGMTTSTVEGLSFGYVTAFGEVNNIKTDQDSDGVNTNEGDFVYLSSTIEGAWVVTPPTIEVPVGIITSSHATEGKIAISISRPPSMQGIRDVVLDDPITQVEGLLFDPVNSLWKNSSLVQTKGAMFKISGDAADPVNNDPTIELSFNIATITKEAAIGVYRVTLTVATLFGLDILEHLIPSFSVSSTELVGGDPVLKTSYITTFDPAASPVWFEFTFYEAVISGTGANAEVVLVETDMTDLDVVSFLGMFA